MISKRKGQATQRSNLLDERRFQTIAPPIYRASISCPHSTSEQRDKMVNSGFRKSLASHTEIGWQPPFIIIIIVIIVIIKMQLRRRIYRQRSLQKSDGGCRRHRAFMKPSNGALISHPSLLGLPCLIQVPFQPGFRVSQKQIQKTTTTTTNVDCTL